jgi:sporulation protein YlmC with PRC-barrel domain
MSTLDARLHLLDRQLLDEDGNPAGIVDDLELDGVEFDRAIEKSAPAPRVTGLLSGQLVATRIFGGGPPRSRLQEIPWELVNSVGVVVKLKPMDSSFDGQWVERWLRNDIIRHIPGGRHAAE